MGAAPQGASILLRSTVLLTSAGAWACDGPRPLLDSAHDGADRRVAQALNLHENPIMQEQTGEPEHPALDLPHYPIMQEQPVGQGQHPLGEDEASASSVDEATGHAAWTHRYLLGEGPSWEREWVRSALVLENWFCEGRATSLAMAMVVQAIRLRLVEAYEGWAGPSVTWLSQWAPHFDGLPSSSKTPVVLYQWAAQVERLLWLRFEGADSSSSEAESEGDAASFMERAGIGGASSAPSSSSVVDGPAARSAGSEVESRSK